MLQATADDGIGKAPRNLDARAQMRQGVIVTVVNCFDHSIAETHEPSKVHGSHDPASLRLSGHFQRLKNAPTFP